MNVSRLKMKDDALSMAVMTLIQLQDEKKALAIKLTKAEKVLLPLLPSTRKDGVTHTVVGDYDVAVTPRINRKINMSRMAELPAEVRTRAFPTTPKVSLRELSWLKDNNPAMYKKVRAAFTVSPGKAAIKISFVGEA